MIEYPVELPFPTRDGFALEAANKILRTEMQSGRARQRIRFTSVPSFVSLRWIFTTPQAQLFEGWADDVVGAGWFALTLRTPIGLTEHQARFLESPQGPALFGIDRWAYTARVELRDKPKVAPGWAVYAPQYILLSGLFDKAINQEWPESKYQTYMGAFDEGINQEWPE